VKREAHHSRNYLTWEGVGRDTSVFLIGAGEGLSGIYSLAKLDISGFDTSYLGMHKGHTQKYSFS